MSRGTLWRVLAVGLPMLAALVAPLASVDLTFLLRAGSAILASGAIPNVDSWTFTAAGTPWLDQQWGSEVILQLVYGAAGWTGLVVLRAALVGLAFALLLATVRTRAPKLGAIGSALLVLAAFIVSADALALRAQLFAIVLFAATLYLLAIRVRSPRAVWLIPVLAAVWANVHGTFLFAPALCGLAWLADLYEATSGPARETRGHRAVALHGMLLVGLVATVATLLNPFGPAVWSYVANLTSNPTIAARVSEWRPPTPLTVPGALVYLSVLVVAGLAVWRVRSGVRAARPAEAQTGRAFRSSVVIPWPALLTLGLFGGFSLVSGRGAAWWPFVGVFVIAPWLQPATARVPRPTRSALRRLNAAIAIAMVVVGVVLLPAWRPIGAAGVPTGVASYAPQGIAARLQVSCDPGIDPVRPVWNPQVWGSWLEFAVPCHTYATDSRVELFSNQVWADDQTVATAAPGWDQVLARYGVTVVVTDPTTEPALDAALGSSGSWARVYTDADGSIWALSTYGTNVSQ